MKTIFCIILILFLYTNYTVCMFSDMFSKLLFLKAIYFTCLYIIFQILDENMMQKIYSSLALVFLAVHHEL